MTNQNFELLSSIEGQFANVSEIKSQLLTAVKVPLDVQSPLIFNEGQKTRYSAPPESYGVYRIEGGECLGVVGKDFTPFDLGKLLDVISTSVLECGSTELDLSKLKYTEHYGGRKVTFDLPLKPRIITGSPMVGDVIETKLQFKTGFDGLTKIGLGHYSYRLWCSNGAGSWKADMNINLKNVQSNMTKTLLLCNEIVKAVSEVDEYIEQLNQLAKRKLKKSDLNKLISHLVKFDIDAETEKAKLEGRTLHPKRAKLLDEIHEALDIEMSNTGSNMYSFLQGITRFSTHNSAEGNESELIFGTASQYNRRVHELVLLH